MLRSVILTAVISAAALAATQASAQASFLAQRKPYQLTLPEREANVEALTRVLQRAFPNYRITIVAAYVYREANGSFTYCGGMGAGNQSHVFVYQTTLPNDISLDRESDWKYFGCEDAVNQAPLR